MDSSSSRPHLAAGWGLTPPRAQLTMKATSYSSLNYGIWPMSSSAKIFLLLHKMIDDIVGEIIGFDLNT